MGWVITKNKRFYLHEGETLLNGLLRTEESLSFECRQGYCGTCKTRLKIHTGSTAHTLPPLCQLEGDEVLACCCVVTGVAEILD